MSQQNGNQCVLIKATNLQNIRGARSLELVFSEGYLNDQKGFTEVKLHAMLGIEPLN